MSGLLYNSPASVWEEALPLGNGRMGSDYDPKNALDIEKFLNRKEKIHPDDTFIMVDADSLPLA